MSKSTEASKAAQALSKRGAAKGGRARASVLTTEERREIAQKASRARWAKEGKGKPAAVAETPGVPTPSAPDDLPFSAFRGTLEMGNLELECHVLSDGRRVMTASEIVRVLRGTRSNPPTIQRYFD